MASLGFAGALLWGKVDLAARLPVAAQASV